MGSEFGIGYLPRNGSALVCVDFDGLLKDGELEPPNFPAIASYTEVSTSGTGLHVLVKRPTAQSPLTFDDANDWVGFIGSDSKFFTVSLDPWADQQEIVGDPDLIEWVLDCHLNEVSAHAAARAKREAEWADARIRQEKSLSSHWFQKLPQTLRAKCASEALAALPPRFVKGYDTWLQVGMALKLADSGGELFCVWACWSQNAPNYDGRTSEKWDQLATELLPIYWTGSVVN